MVINKNFIDLLRLDNVFVDDIYDSLIERMGEPQTDEECRRFLVAYAHNDNFDRNEEEREDYRQDLIDDDEYDEYSYKHDDDFYDEMAFEEYPEMYFENILAEDYDVYVDKNVETGELEFHNEEEHEEWYKTTPEYKREQAKEERNQRLQAEIEDKISTAENGILVLSETFHYPPGWSHTDKLLTGSNVEVVISPDSDGHYCLDPIFKDRTSNSGEIVRSVALTPPPEWKKSIPQGLINIKNYKSTFDTLENAIEGAKMYIADIDSTDRLVNPLKRTMINDMKEMGLEYIGEDELNGKEVNIKFFAEGHKDGSIQITDADYVTFDKWSDVRKWIHDHDEKTIPLEYSGQVDKAPIYRNSLDFATMMNEVNMYENSEREDVNCLKEMIQQSLDNFDGLAFNDDIKEGMKNLIQEYGQERVVRVLAKMEMQPCSLNWTNIGRRDLDKWMEANFPDYEKMSKIMDGKYSVKLPLENNYSYKDNDKNEFSSYLRQNLDSYKDAINLAVLEGYAREIVNMMDDNFEKKKYYYFDDVKIDNDERINCGLNWHTPNEVTGQVAETIKENINDLNANSRLSMDELSEKYDKLYEESQKANREFRDLDDFREDRRLEGHAIMPDSPFWDEYNKADKKALNLEKKFDVLKAEIEFIQRTDPKDLPLNIRVESVSLCGNRTREGLYNYRSNVSEVVEVSGLNCSPDRIHTVETGLMTIMNNNDFKIDYTESVIINCTNDLVQFKINDKHELDAKERRGEFKENTPISAWEKENKKPGIPMSLRNNLKAKSELVSDNRSNNNQGQDDPEGR